jgi:F0F1-type ATP synthase assembly protein I
MSKSRLNQWMPMAAAFLAGVLIGIGIGMIL